jgi:hypothetical protein
MVARNNFKLLYEHYSVFCKKIRLLIKGAFTNHQELLALEILLDYLDRNEKDLEELRARADEKTEALSADSFEALLGRLLMENEDYQLLQKIADARRKGGPNWEALQSILNINGPHQTFENSGKSV